MNSQGGNKTDQPNRLKFWPPSFIVQSKKWIWNLLFGTPPFAPRNSCSGGIHYIRYQFILYGNIYPYIHTLHSPNNNRYFPPSSAPPLFLSFFVSFFRFSFPPPTLSFLCLPAYLIRLQSSYPVDFTPIPHSTLLPSVVFHLLRIQLNRTDVKEDKERANNLRERAKTKKIVELARN